MNRTQRGQLLVTTPAAKRYEVPLRDGSTWTGTRRELAETYPEWLGQAKEVQLAPAAEQDDASIYDTRMSSSSRRYYMPDVAQGRANVEMRPGVARTKIPPRRSALPAQQTEDIPAGPKRQRRGLRAHPLLLLGIGMLAMLALWFLLQAAVSWWSVHQDDVQYGRPRTAQYDVVVGHNDSAANPSHFIVVNLNRHVLIIELPGGESSKARLYSGPTLYTDNAELIPVTLMFADVNGDGRVDMILKIQDQRIIFINDGTQFRPLKPGEHVTIPQ